MAFKADSPTPRYGPGAHTQNGLTLRWASVGGPGGSSLEEIHRTLKHPKMMGRRSDGLGRGFSGLHHVRERCRLRIIGRRGDWCWTTCRNIEVALPKPGFLNRQKHVQVEHRSLLRSCRDQLCHEASHLRKIFRIMQQADIERRKSQTI